MTSLPIDHIITAILKAGLSAPSADNHHRFSVQYVQASGVSKIRCFTHSREAHYPRRRRLVDWIGYGAAIENMLIEAKRLGLRPKLTLHSDDNGIQTIPTLFAEIELHSGASPSDENLAQAIPRRVTNRKPFLRRPLTAEDKAEILLQIDRPCAHWFSSRETKKQCATLSRLAESERFRSQELHDELYSSLYFDADRPYGISIRGLETPRPLEHLFRLFKNVVALKIGRLLGVDSIFGFFAGALPIYWSGEVVVLTTRGDSSLELMQLGQTMERIWLAATTTGVAVQPQIAACLYASEKIEGCSTTTQVELSRLWKGLLPQEEFPMIMLRMGYAAPPRWKSPRPSVDSLLKK